MGRTFILIIFINLHSFANTITLHEEYNSLNLKVFTWGKDETLYTVLEYFHFLVVMTTFSKYFVSDKSGIHVIRGKRL